MYLKARHQTVLNSRTIRLIVWHSMEAPEKPTTAEGVARYFASTDRVASAHACFDSDSAVECVKPMSIAYGAAGANSDGYHLELAGYAGQGPAGWRDAFSLATIRRACAWVKAMPELAHIPARWLTDAQLADGRTAGHVTHAQVSRVFKRSDHTDPGPGFPTDYVMAQLSGAPSPTSAPEDDMPLNDIDKAWIRDQVLDIVRKEGITNNTNAAALRAQQALDKANEIELLLKWAFNADDSGPDFKEPAFGEAGEITRILRRLDKRPAAVIDVGELAAALAPHLDDIDVDRIKSAVKAAFGEAFSE